MIRPGTGDNAEVTSPWLSVITVVRDDVEGFRRTLASLSAQDLEGVEFVVIDGSSDPAGIPQALGSVHARYQWVAPSGIYPAMNAGLEAASGEFIYFANAGDTFASDLVLARVRPLLAGQSWGFGPVEIVEQSGRTVVTPRWDYSRERAALFSRGHFPAHQGTFVRRELLLAVGGFDTSYAIAADYAMALKLSTIAEPVEIDVVIAQFHEGGTSTQRWQESFREFHRARREILAPTGLDAARERWHTGTHFGAVWLGRNVVAPLRGDRS